MRLRDIISSLKNKKLASLTRSRVYKLEKSIKMDSYDLDYWTWDDEDDNDLESFCRDAKIMITADQLRKLLDEARKSHNKH